MHLTRLIYTSTMCEGVNVSNIEEIIDTARENNQPLNITGLLCFNRNYFLQCLEGSRADVNAVYQKILKDNRHTNVEMLDYIEIQDREFGDWSMGYVPSSDITTSLNLKHSGTSEFNPYTMTGDAAYSLMRDLKSSLPTA